MNEDRMKEIARQTGMSVDEVADMQLDREQHPGKYMARRFPWKLAGLLTLASAVFSLGFTNCVYHGRTWQRLQSAPPSITNPEAIVRNELNQDWGEGPYHTIARTLTSKAGEEIAYFIYDQTR